MKNIFTNGTLASGQSVRGFRSIDGNLYLQAFPVATMLGFDYPQKALHNYVKDEDKALITNIGFFGEPLVITENGLRDLADHSPLLDDEEVEAIVNGCLSFLGQLKLKLPVEYEPLKCDQTITTRQLAELIGIQQSVLVAFLMECKLIRLNDNLFEICKEYEQYGFTAGNETCVRDMKLEYLPDLLWTGKGVRFVRVFYKNIGNAVLSMKMY